MMKWTNRIRGIAGVAILLAAITAQRAVAADAVSTVPAAPGEQPGAAPAAVPSPVTPSNVGLGLEVPEIPAFSVLGLNPAKIDHPTTPRELAAAINNGFDENGNFKSAVAIEFNAGTLFNRNRDEDANYRIGEYYRGHWSIACLFPGSDRYEFCQKQPDKLETRMKALGLASPSLDVLSTLKPSSNEQTINFWRILWYRTTFSLATAKGVDEADKSFKAAGGVRVTPFDNGDSRYLVAKCVDENIEHLASYHPLLDALSARLLAPNVTPAEREEISTSVARLQTAVAPDYQKFTIEDVQQIACSLGFEDLLNLGGAQTKCPKPKRSTSENPFDNAEALLAGAHTLKAPAENETLRQKWITETVNRCQASPAVRTDAQNRSAWSIGAAPTWISRTGNTSKMRWNGASVWTSLSLGWDLLYQKDNGDKDPASIDNGLGQFAADKFQLIVQGMYHFGEKAVTEVPGMTSTVLAKQDTWHAGGRLRFLLTDRFNLSVEALAQNVSPDDAAKTNFKQKGDTFYRYAIIPAYKISDTFWLEVSAGTDRDRNDGKNGGFVLTSLKLAERP
jgi:hypothetical protein